MSGSFPLRVRLLDETTSTNDEVKHALAAGEDEGLVVRARRQTGGYGRQGRSWASPEGGLYASLLLHPRVDAAVLPTLSLVASVALREALVHFVPECEQGRVRIKWPNDIICLPPDGADGHTLEGPKDLSIEHDPANPSADAGAHTLEGPGPVAPVLIAQDTTVRGQSSALTFRKLCGISLERYAGGVCLGMGVNVFAPDVSERVGGKNIPVYLAEFAESPDPVAHFRPVGPCAPFVESTDGFLDRVFAGIMEEFAPAYERWQAEGFAPFAERYRERAALAGRFVRVMDRAGIVVTEGQAEGIDDDGRLMLRASDGSLSPVQSGEVHLA